MKHYAFILILAQLLLAGCSDFDQFYSQRSSKGPALGVHQNTPSHAVARLGSRIVTLEEVLASIENPSPKTKLLYLSSPEQLTRRVNNYINREVLYAEALKRGMERRPDIRREIERFKKRLLVRTLSREATSKRFSEEEIAEYYEQNKEDYEQLRASAVIVRINPSKGITRDKALSRAQAAYQMALAEGDFSKVVARFSDDERAKSKGGDLGFIEKGRFPKEIEDALFALGEGDISKPIEIPNGFMVVKITQPPHPLPLSKIRKRVEYDLRRRIFLDYLSGLRRKAGIEVFKEKIKEITERKDEKKD